MNVSMFDVPVKVKVAQLCLALCDPMDCSLRVSSVHGIIPARILEWVAVSFSRGSSQPRDVVQSPSLQVDSLPAELPGKPTDLLNCHLLFFFFPVPFQLFPLPVFQLMICSSLSFSLLIIPSGVFFISALYYSSLILLYILNSLLKISHSVHPKSS